MNQVQLILLVLALVITALAILSRFLAIAKIYKNEVIKELETESSPSGFLTQADLDVLPQPVRQYIKYVGAVGKPKLHNVRVAFEGGFKMDAKQQWLKCIAEQYNFFVSWNRFFYIKVFLGCVSVAGRDRYYQGKGNMLIRLASLLTVANAKGPEMDQAALITLFNDMCLFAPASLIDPRINWQTIDPLTVRGVFEADGRKVTALLYFNEQGELLNFVTEDRYDISGKNARKVKWSTPVNGYTEFADIKVPREVAAVWHYPEGDFCYARFQTIDIEYNCREFK
ncbi:MAG TPA: DUF6544 family protein [Bacillota bacterium]|nr:DUF6544 family protein [Bacillota bacterium]